MVDEVWLVLSTFPDEETAAGVAEQLVAEQLAACANILPAIRSIYRWQGKVEKADEALVLFKTKQGRLEELQGKLKSLHPFDVPEILALPIAAGLPAYLRWVGESCTAPGSV